MKKIKTKSPSMLQSHLKSCDLDTIAESVGLLKRTPKKISPFMLLATFVLLGSYSSPAYSTCASIIAVFFRLRISKQAIWKRVQSPLVEFLRLVLQQKLYNTVTAALPSDSGCFASFKRVLVQDSTTIKLPYRLANIYTSTSNKKHSKPAATLKIQAIIDLKNNVFTWFQLTPFRTSDQISGKDILSDIHPGDLLVRDLGYYNLKVFKKVIDAGASVLSRCKFKTALSLPNGKRIYLKDILRRYKVKDINVIAGTNKKVALRLVAIPIPQKIANKRRLKLDKDIRHKTGKPPTKEQLDMLNWEIFLTNVSEEIWSPQDIANVYGCRWRIENIFKTWKSTFKITNLSLLGSKHQTEATIYGRLIFIMCFQNHFFNPLRQANRDSEFSMFKVAKFWQDHFLVIISNPDILKNILNNISDYGGLLKYEKRKRLNFEQIFIYMGI